MHVCVGASLLVLYLFKAVLFSQERTTVWNTWSGNSFVVIFTIFLSPHTSINQVITVGESKILCLYYIFLLPDFALLINKESEGEDVNQKVSSASSEKTIVSEFTVLSRSQQVMSNFTTPQLRSVLPYSMAEMPSLFPTPPVPWCLGKNVYKLGGSSVVFSQMPKMEALRTRTETKLLHSLAPWSRGGPVLICVI